MGDSGDERRPDLADIGPAVSKLWRSNCEHGDGRPSDAGDDVTVEAEGSTFDDRREQLVEHRFVDWGATSPNHLQASAVDIDKPHVDSTVGKTHGRHEAHVSRANNTDRARTTAHGKEIASRHRH